jgi:hypothetical protein
MPPGVLEGSAPDHPADNQNEYGVSIRTTLEKCICRIQPSVSDGHETARKDRTFGLVLQGMLDAKWPLTRRSSRWMDHRNPTCIS